MKDFTKSRALALLLSADRALLERLQDDAGLSDWRLIADVPDGPFPSDAAGIAAPMLIICDIRSGSETADGEIARAAQYAADHDIAFIAWTNMERLDEAAFLAAAADPQILVEPERAELVFALTRARVGKHQRAKEHRGESRELIRLSDELADMARRIAALTRQDGGGGNVRSDPLSYRGSPPGAGVPLGQTSLPPVKARQIRDMIRLRRMREEAFESDLFADPAWDMLLDLMASRLEGRAVSVSNLCIASAVPATTALRWIKLMTDRALLERHADDADARRIFIALSKETADKLQRLLATMLSSGAPPV